MPPAGRSASLSWTASLDMLRAANSRCSSASDIDKGQSHDAAGAHDERRPGVLVGGDLAALGCTLFRARLVREALTLAAVFALAVVLCAFAGAFALAVVGAVALDYLR